MSNIIIADASPLIALGSIDKLSVLFELFGQVIIPEIVAGECLIDQLRPGAIAITHAIDKKFIRVHSAVINHTDDVLAILDQGEAAAISLAHSMQLPLLIDEKLGRGVAKNLGVKIIGTIGILLLAKQKKLLRSIKPILMSLKNGHYFLSDKLIKDALARANEK